MAPSKRSGKQKASAASNSSSTNGSLDPPAPFKRPPEVLEPFIQELSQKHIYITHIDAKPAAFKRKMFLVPVTLNVSVAILFVWRMYSILPWYWKLFMSGFGHPNEMTFPFHEASWSELSWEVWKRGIVMFIDFVLFVFVWPWPVEFTLGTAHGNPTRWRWNVGFRDKEIYVRRSRDWDKMLRDIFKDADSKKILLAYTQQATSPMLQEQKTGYLLMNDKWDLDWNCMVLAHKLVDKKDVALEAFRNVILVYHQDYGWICHDLKLAISAEEDEKRRQVFAFRDALTAMGKENLFFRWIEIVQFESTQPGGFGPEKQEAAAKQIRELFEAENINFDDLWKETVGTKA
ncbi:hypothetical protein N5P37_002113 [Trichoderma harzianum]|uniref:Uncharacterized protein n=1 Tax=Trichoderma harzianum CBS 226.95 TaxID=983964 RepID=A0A2T3ZWU3_TRIHA|nr:hypothetical protein M431DRAFT_126532 [Trichoderma harzianum CBS 226.95]KAK0764647.1 hypothetical protein N5P37_002113 [Trichoderma harzianum]PKK53753.1 hypothetical protein CI102_1766 [Trichoderma harzianum]PTB49277.1 hypothetical protein M431DRAFT_126532 [Trichoderma harzianum CBS 226.95]